MEIKSDVPDHTSSTMNVSREDGTGNFVKLNCEGVIAAIPHLMEKSITVAVGDHVDGGTVLGKIGLSGFAQEPHLHIQASVYDRDSALVGVPIQFGAKQPVRNDIIRIE